MTQQLFARLAGTVALETFAPPEGRGLADCFHPAVAVQFVECPPETVAGSTYDGEVWTHPEPVEPPQE